MTETMTTGQAAKALGVSEPRLQDLMRRRKIPAPEMTGARRKWTPKDLDVVRRWMKENAA